MTPEKQKEHRRKARQKQISMNRAFVIAYKQAHLCLDCGEEDEDLLEFHHVNPADKRFEIWKGVTGRSHRQLKEEIARCVLLCRGCHKKRHREAW